MVLNFLRIFVLIHRFFKARTHMVRVQKIGQVTYRGINTWGASNSERFRPILMSRPPMQGIITTRHLVTNASTIISEFGLGAYVRCVTAAMLSRRPVTFLEMVMRMGRT
jgi:hypothetical protein